MGAILKVKDINGNIVMIPALTGPAGRGISSVDTDANDFVITYTDGTTSRASINSTNVQTASSPVYLQASEWQGNESPYSQPVYLSNVTNNSKVDLQPTAEQQEQLQNEGTSLMAVNDNSNVTVYAIGNKPSVNYVMQTTTTEVTSL